MARRLRSRLCGQDPLSMTKPKEALEGGRMDEGVADSEGSWRRKADGRARR